MKLLAITIFSSAISCWNVQVTNQMIHNCKEAIQAPGKLWEQDKSVLLGNLEAAVTLYVRYQQEYQAKAKVSHQWNTAQAAVLLYFLPQLHSAGQRVRCLL